MVVVEGEMSCTMWKERGNVLGQNVRGNMSRGNARIPNIEPATSKSKF